MKTKMLLAALAGAGLITAGPAMAQETLTVWWAKGFYKGEDDAFLAEAEAKGFQPIAIETVSGLNYSRGTKPMMTLYRR